MNPKQAFMVGLATLVALIGLVMLMLWFGELERWSVGTYRLHIETDDARGVQPGSMVTLNGVRVGRVGDVLLSGTQPYPVRITALIDSGQEIPEPSRVVIDSSLLGGSSTVWLVPEDPGSAPYATDGQTPIRGTLGSSMDGLRQELDQRLQPILEAADAVAQLSGSAQTLAEEMTQLVSGDGPAEGTPSLTTAIGSFQGLAERLDETVSSAQRWFDDETLWSDARATIANARSLTDQAKGTMNEIDAFARRLDSRTETLLQQLLPVADQLSTTLEQVNQLASAANQGQGTVAQLLHNPDLYRSLDDSATQLKRVLSELELVIQKVKDEGLKVGL